MSIDTPRRAAVALLIAILSVVLISAGSATAAKLITGKDIKNSSVTGKDIKNSSLTGKDIRNKSVGAADLSAAAKKSLTGPAVLTDVYAASQPVKGMTQDNSTVVLDKILPSGKPYLFTAKLNLSTTGVGLHSCELRSGPDVIDSTVISTTTPNSKNLITMTGVTASSGLARITCTVSGGSGVAQQVRLIAVPVAGIS